MAGVEVRIFARVLVAASASRASGPVVSPRRPPGSRVSLGAGEEPSSLLSEDSSSLPTNLLLPPFPLLRDLSNFSFALRKQKPE